MNHSRGRVRADQMPQRRTERGVLPGGQRPLEPGGVDDEILPEHGALHGRQPVNVDPIFPFLPRA
ncbi:hypothetical protein [Streptomyces sp. NPDC060366]|uniref:hypothetical protein n=1 Tax=Streptomyces sp. NPDC060366 TaxID=3347105 RepID=UPI003665B131